MTKRRKFTPEFKAKIALENMAGGIVRSLEGFRRRKTEKEL